MSDLKQALRAKLVTEFGVDRNTLDDNTKLFSGGLVDSLGVMDFVSFVEHEIGKPVPIAHVTLENFDSIAQIVAFVQTLTGNGKGA